MEKKTFDKISFQYNTGPIPPPFCYKYLLEVSIGNTGKVHGKLKLEYFDREDLTEEEIFDEGFSLEDDYHWEGVLPGAWGAEIKKKIESASWKKKLIANEDGSEFLVKLDHGGKSELLQPADSRDWEIFSQEIMQAIFELGNKEAPLIIRFFQKDGSKQIELEIKYQFSNREVEINDHNARTTIDWSEGQKLIKYIFGIDYFPEHAQQTIPKNNGAFISPGDGMWYALEPEKDQARDAEKMKRLINLLLNYVN